MTIAPFPDFDLTKGLQMLHPELYLGHTWESNAMVVGVLTIENTTIREGTWSNLALTRAVLGRGKSYP